jgi:hypothetical protein
MTTRLSNACKYEGHDVCEAAGNGKRCRCACHRPVTRTYETRAYSCGCVAGPQQMTHCPTHAAAPAMRDELIAARALFTEMARIHDDAAARRAASDIDALLIKIESA